MKMPAPRVPSQNEFALRLKPIAAIALAMMACAAVPQAMAEGSAKDTTKSGTLDQVQFDDTFLRAQNGEAIDVNPFHARECGVAG